jgi:hypothetical protein
MATTKHKRLAKLSPKLAERLTDIEVKYMEARLNGATMQEATAATGFAPFVRAASKIENGSAEKCLAVFNREGVTIERIAKKVADKLNAKTTKFFSHQGTVLDSREVEDHDTQLKAAELGLKALGALKAHNEADSTEGRSETHAVRLVVTDERAAARLAGLLSRSGPAGVAIDVDAEVDEDPGRQGF